MTCKQYRSQVADWLAGQLDDEKQKALRAHGAVCVSCARLKHEEAAVRDAWCDLAAATKNAAPIDITALIAARLDTVQPSGAPAMLGFYKSKSFKTLFPVGAVLCCIALLARLHSATNTGYGNTGFSQRFMAKPIANASISKLPPLTVMLTEVRWRSSDERKLQREPPAYNEEIRRVLLSEEE